MKIYYDSCHSTVALRKHKLLMQHIRSEAFGSLLSNWGTRWRCPPLGEDCSSIPPLPLHSGLLQPWSDACVGGACVRTLGGQSLLDVLAGPSSPQRSFTGFQHHLPSLLSQQKSSFLCPWTPTFAQVRHSVLWCALAPPFLFFSSFFSFTCSQTQGQDKTFQGLVNVLK